MAEQVKVAIVVGASGAIGNAVTQGVALGIYESPAAARAALTR